MRFLSIFLILIAALALSACAKLTLAWADLTPDGPAAAPNALGPFEGAGLVASVADWENVRAPALREAFERDVYGVFPDGYELSVVKRRVLDQTAFGGRGVLEEWTLSAQVEFNGDAVDAKGADRRDGFPIQILLPADAASPAPAIIMETFCPWWDVIPHPALTKPEGARSLSGGVIGGVATYVFGRHICTPPIETILDQGYALVSVYPDAVMPDRRKEGREELRRLSAGHKDDRTRWGAIAAWAWLYSRIVDAIEDDPRFDRDAMIAWGHSRYAKAALLAAAYDDRIDGVIAHQSGTGGASLNRNKKGESVKSITANYPHWFSSAYAEYAGREDDMPVDQHLLLALIAPRPVLLGNARRDVWSDPNGAFRAAMGADPVYKLYGADGLAQMRLDQWRPSADLAFWIRPGTHGVVKEDWPAFLEFLEAHFAPGR